MTRASPERSKGTSAIARVRMERNVTQEELAAATGISVDMLRRIETGRRKNTTVRQLFAIAEALGVSAGNLVERDWLQTTVPQLVD